MTLALAESSPAMLVTLDNVSWELYEQLVRAVEEQHISITYDNGRMTLMSPLPMHERVKSLIRRFIETASLTLNIPIASLGSTTWRKRSLGKGLEPDECYYVQNEEDVRGLEHFDLDHDPVPDLAIEVDVTNHPMDRPSIYAALGVNELWRHDGKAVKFFKLGSNRSYQSIETSEAFPMLTPVVIDDHLALFGQMSETEIVRRFQAWVQEHAAS